MSLLVISGANRVAQGVIRGLHSSGKYEKIVVADVFPNYYYVQKFLNFKDTLTQNNTKITETKLTDRTDLETAIRNATQVVYVTHNYYLNVPSKLSLLNHTAKLSKQAGVKRLLAITPVENDHYGEQNPQQAVAQSESHARSAFPDLVELKTDITFGPDSNVLTQLLERLANNQSIYFKPSGQRPAPVHTANVAQAAQKILEASSLSNLRYVARGAEEVSWANIIQTLASASDTTAQLNKSTLQSVISPLSDNVLSQSVHSAHYLNLARLIHQYQTPSLDGSKDLSSLGVSNLISFSQTYKPDSVAASSYKTSCCNPLLCL